MNSISIALCLILATVQLSYQQCPAAVFNPSEKFCLDVTNTNLGGQSAPLTSYFTESLSEGQTIEIKVSATNTFTVNLVNKEDKNINGLHLSFRFDLGHLVINWYQTINNWDYSKESRPANIGRPTVGDYVILIGASSSGWRISVNGVQTSYPVNIPFNKLNGVWFTGSAKVYSLRQIASSANLPAVAYLSQTGRTSFQVFSYPGVNFASLSTPFNHPLGTSLKEGSLVELRVVPGSGVSSINFYNQASNKDLNVLHLSIRPDRNMSVLNHHLKLDNWDYSKEVYPSTFPFVRDTESTVGFLCSSNGWTIFVNGKEYAKYPAYISCDKVDLLTLVGPIKLNSIRVFA